MLREMQNWFKPSQLQHWYIARAIRAGFAPIKQSAEVIKEFWDTWNKVYKPNGNPRKD